MSRAVSLATLLATVRRRSDTIGQTLRHPDADVIADINASWQALREKVSEAGSGFYLKATTKTAMTAGAASNCNWGTLTLPSDCARVYGVDLYVTSTDVRCLRPASWAERNSFSNVFGANVGMPVAFALMTPGTESTTSVTAGTLAVFPAPDQAYQHVIWYVPIWADISSSNTTHVFDCLAGFDDWVAWDVTIKIRSRDGDLQGGLASAMAERDRTWAERIQPACRFNRAAPGRRVDMAAINRRAAYNPYYRTR